MSESTSSENPLEPVAIKIKNLGAKDLRLKATKALKASIKLSHKNIPEVDGPGIIANNYGIALHQQKALGISLTKNQAFDFFTKGLGLDLGSYSSFQRKYRLKNMGKSLWKNRIAKKKQGLKEIFGFYLCGMDVHDRTDNDTGITVISPKIPQLRMAE